MYISWKMGAREIFFLEGRKEIIVLNVCWLHSFNVTCLTALGIWILHSLWKFIIMGGTECLYFLCVLGASLPATRHLRIAVWGHYAPGQNFLEQLGGEVDHTLNHSLSPWLLLTILCPCAIVIEQHACLYLLGAGTTPASQNNPKLLQMFSNVPRGAKSSLVENPCSVL